MKKTLSIFIVIFSLLAVPALAQAEKYTCPMHPHYVADRPGTCPICGMDLVELDTDDEAEAGEASKDKQTQQTRTSVTIDPETIQNSGIRKKTAQMASFGTLVRSYGDVTENIRLQNDISARVEGWIVDLSVQAMGDEVKRVPRLGGSAEEGASAEEIDASAMDQATVSWSGVAAEPIHDNQAVRLIVRPESLSLADLGRPGGLAGEVRGLRFTGALSYALVELDVFPGRQVEVLIDGPAGTKAGARVAVVPRGSGPSPRIFGAEP